MGWVEQGRRSRLGGLEQLWPGRQARIKREDKTAEIASSPDQGQHSIVLEQTSQLPWPRH